MSRLSRSIALVSLLAAAPLMGQDVGLPVGETPTGVIIEDLDGNDVDLSQWIGTKPVLVEFWATWCGQCEELLPEMIRAYDRFGDQVEFLAVSVAINQSRRSIRRHLERHPIPFAVLWDTRGRGTRAFKAPTTSYVAILNGNGQVFYTGVGPDQPIEEILARMLGTEPQ